MRAVLDYLDRLLTGRLRVLSVQTHRFRAGQALAEGVAESDRLILARSGTLPYRVEGLGFALRRGMMLLVPAGTRRSWRVPPRHSFEMSWVVFEPAARLELPLSHLLLPRCDLLLEAAAFERLFQWQAAAGRRHSLRMEGELKAVLARFLSQCAEQGAQEARNEPFRPGFSSGAAGRAMAYLSKNFREPDALLGLPERCGLSANHFRLVFKRAVGMSARAYLTALRMKAARVYLQETGMAIKEIAQAVGYRDALYFSRHYRAYWKAAPTKDRVFRP